MSIGPDISEALTEVGNSYTIKRESGDVAGGYLDITPNTQVTKPFIREFFLEVTMDYETSIQPGEVLELDTSGDKFLLMNFTPSFFENEVAYYDGVIYKCNVSGELFRPSGEEDWNDSTYRREETFEPVESDCHALLVPPEFGGEIDTEEEIGILEMDRQALYIPSSAGIQVLDRYEASSGEYYRVEAVKRRRYPAVDLVIVGEDTR